MDIKYFTLSFCSVASGLDSPRSTSADATTISVAWSPPRQPNGIVLSYRISILLASDSSLVSSNVINITAAPSATLNATFHGLTPSTSYVVQLEVTNTAGRSLAPSLLANTTDGSKLDANVLESFCVCSRSAQYTIVVNKEMISSVLPCILLNNFHY